MNKLKPWKALLLAPIVGFIFMLMVTIAFKYLIWVMIFIGCFIIGMIILAPFVNTEEEKS